MATYLIDYENVSKDGLNGITRLTADDTVVIFYSDRADRMTFGLHRRLNETKAAVEYKKVEVGGHNALDFQLATYLGYLIAKNSSESYCIVSNDKGFEFLAGYWRKPMYDVTLTKAISESPQAEERRNSRRNSRKRKPAPCPEGDANETVSAEVQSDDAEKTVSAGVVPDDVNETAAAEVTPDDANETADPEKASDEEIMSEAENGSEADESEADEEAAANESAASYSPDVQESETADNVIEIINILAEKKEAEEGGKTVESSETEDDRAEAGGEKKALSDAGKRSRGGRRSSSRKKKADAPLLSDVKSLLKNAELPETDLREIAVYVEKYKTKQGVNNALVRKFGNQKGGEFYQTIKTLLKDKKGRAQ